MTETRKVVRPQNRRPSSSTGTPAIEAPLYDDTGKIVVQGIVIDFPDVLTDETLNDRNAIATLRQIVAQSGVRVTEQALQQAEAFAIESFAPNFVEAMIFKLVERDATQALRCSSAFRKQYKPEIKIRPEAREFLMACRNRQWRVALATTPTEAEAMAMQRAGIWNLIDIKGPPPGTRIKLPDVRILEHLSGKMGSRPGNCVMLGNRIDINIRPANLVHMNTIMLLTGKHGTRQLPRDLKDVPTYVSRDLNALMELLPNLG